MKNLLLLLSVFAFACSSPTTLVKSWRVPESTFTPEEFKKVMVVAFVKDEANRKIAEDRVTSINEHFFPSYPVFSGQEVMENKELVLSTLKEQGFDAVITMSLLLKAADDKWVAEKYQGGYYEYQNSYMNDYYRPGYYVDASKYYIITNVFSIKSNKLIWSATTVTPEPASLQEGIDSILYTVVKQMKKDGFLPGKKKR